MGPLWGSVTGHFAAHRRAWALLLLAVACLSARADERPPDLVTVGVLRDWPPEYSLDSQGRPQGFAIDVMNEVARRAGLTVRTVQFETFPEMERALATGEIDVIPNFGIVEGRLPEAAFTRPVETFSVGLFVRQQTRGIESISDLPGQKVAAVAGNVGIRLLADRGVQPVVYPTVTSALFDLLAGQVDAVVYPSSVMWARAREAGVADHLREVGPPLAEIKRAIAARASDQALVERLRKAVDGLVGTPDFQRIYVRWYGTAPPFWTVRRVLVAAGVVLAGLLLAVVAWRFRVLARHNRELRRHIAERERAQVALAASEEKYRQIVETSGEGVWVADAAGVTSFVNRRMAEMLGRTPDQMVGRPVTDFVDPELAGEATRYLQRRREGRAEVHDFTLRHVDGRAL
jgi:PAS domain S-box-containing protein